MSFDHSVFQAEFVKHLQNRLGWPKDISGDAAAIASDVIAQTHGGERHYIQSRLIDRNGIRAFYKDGLKVDAISRQFGISTRTVFRVLKE